MKKILVVDHKENLQLPGLISLQNKGYQFEFLHDSSSLEEKLQDLAIAGVFLAFDFDSHSIVSLIREIKMVLVDAPLVVYMQKNDEFNTVLALEAGSDEVVSLEMNKREAQARVMKIFRIYQSFSLDKFENGFLYGDCIQIGEFRIYPQIYKLAKGEQEINLTPREILLLILLYKNRDRIVTREEIMLDWRKTFGRTSSNKRIIDSVIYKMRDKIGLDNSSSFNIVTVYQKGYLLKIKDTKLPTIEKSKNKKAKGLKP